MATPSSSATSESSPTLPFTAPLQDPANPPHASAQDVTSRAVQKFKARAEISNVTRNLRARLSYASYKATHNLAHLPLRDIEMQTAPQVQLYSRSLAAKRKANSTAYGTPGANNYYNNPATQGGASPAPTYRKPPVPGTSIMGRPSYYYPANSPETRPMTASLFTSILAPPPTQPARTILNAADPPVAPPARPPASPRTRPSKTASRSHDKSRSDRSRGEKPEKRKARRAQDKGKHKQRRPEVDADGDVDMKAAATLTSLLLNHRPSLGSQSSPRSSMDDSDVDSLHSYSQFAQSSARNDGGDSFSPSTNVASTSAAGVPRFRRASGTPPPGQTLSQTPAAPSHAGTPRPGPTDNEAADLMLFLATSPSPVRKDARDHDAAAYRALNGGSRAKGRVLFPSAGKLESPEKQGTALARGAAGDSFVSSVSSIGGDVHGTPSAAGSRTSTPVPPAKAMSPSPASRPGTPAVGPVPGSHLLPSAAFPASAAPLSSAPSPRAVQAQSTVVDFNLTEFLQPSPSRSGTPQTLQQKPSLGLRADIGRKLFEEEQMRLAMSKQAAAKPDMSIDLMQSSG
ncbi:unnamed protein product [Mycena citricolor]|uniref:Uncharacterized protein n=1 Tax=Mycena citricolor TaxID=2018698 RepID=A0AAD2Q2R7_9AGAR|nr:unnamed protein product [Mycena citricolor]CAK5269678.1 unnamed protein product [Mycena citricolor]